MAVLGEPDPRSVTVGRAEGRATGPGGASPVWLQAEQPLDLLLVAGAKSVSRPRRRVRTLDLCSSRWDRNALRRRSRPVPVTLMRFFAPQSVFIFGMSLSLSFARLVGRGRSPFGVRCRPVAADRRLAARAACCRSGSAGLRAAIVLSVSWRRRRCRRGSRCRSRRSVARRPCVAPGLDRDAGRLGSLLGRQHHHHVSSVEPGNRLGLPMPSICSAIRSRIRLPNSGWKTSRPRNMIVILTL